MAKRKLVELYPGHHRNLRKIQDKAKRDGLAVPSLTQLVNFAVDRSIPEMEEQFLPRKSGK